MRKSGQARSASTSEGRGTQELLRRTVDGLKAELRKPRDAAGVRSEARSDWSQPTMSERSWGCPSLMPDEVRPLVVDKVARRELRDLVLRPQIREDMLEFLGEFRSASLLRSHSLEPRHKVLLVGPPGNGKTSLAEALAFEAGLPFLTVRYDAMMDSFLGETASRLRRLMDFAAACPCLLFFDEFDSVGKERGDAQDVGEIKRVVGSLLVNLDAIPSHTMVVCATNHPELLDRAVWRRFDLRVPVDPPERAQLSEWFDSLQRSLDSALDQDRETFLDLMSGCSYSDVQAFSLDIRRKIVLSEGRLTAGQALRGALAKWSVRLGSSENSKQDADISHREAGARAVPRKPRQRKSSQVPEKALL